MNKGYELIASVLETRYGVGAVQAAPITVLWAAEHALAEQIAEGWNTEYVVNQLKTEIKKLNRVREKYGKIPVYVPFGHQLF